MKTMLTSLVVCFCFLLTAQEKGVSPLPSTLNPPPSTETYAVVVGISDYQDPGIPDLRFADKDAEAFANFLRSPAGGSLDEDHLKVLINKEATQAQFAKSLDWLWEVVGENDKAIIYFSGHGDVEKKSLTQPGFLLCWDAPSRVYMAGGAFPLNMLQEVISTISVQNKAKVIMVADACRSGKLSGSTVGGAQITGSNLAKQYANEIKLLSCQPDEYSIEGEQWGGGRGAFSYHLLDGLYGMADGNADNSVNLLEIGRYLEDKVTTEVAPQSQIPMMVGSRGEKLTDVFPDILAQLKASKNSGMQMFTATESRGIEDDVLAMADSNIVEMYLAFKESIADKKFFCNSSNQLTNDCAEYYFEKLSQEPQLTKLHSSMKRNYAAALQDDAQQVMNTMLKTGLTKEILKKSKPIDVYGAYPVYLDRASELLGRGHYMFSTLQARKHLFEGMVQDEGVEKRKAFRKALNYEPEMALAMVQMARTYQQSEFDSVRYYVEKAKALIPSWIEPYVAESDFYSQKLSDLVKADSVIGEALKIDSVAVLLLYRRASLLRMQKKYGEALIWYDKLVQQTGDEICFPCANLELGGIYHSTKDFTKSAAQFEKTIALDSTFGLAYNFLGMAYHELDRQTEAGQNFKKAIQLDSTNWQAHANLGSLYQFLGQWELAAKATENAAKFGPPFGGIYAQLGNAYTHIPGRQADASATLEKAKQLHPDWPDTYIYLAQLAIINMQPEKAWEYLEQGLAKDITTGFISVKELMSEKDFEAFKKDPKWEALMEKYLPEILKK